MAKYNRIEVFQTMKDTGVVPVFFHPNIDTAQKVLKACYDGGIRVFEWVNRGDFAHEIFSELNKFALNELPGMILGAGSIVDEATAALYIQVGANFIVSPLLNEQIARICNRRKIMWAPGCGSVSEIGKAEELGAEIVKIFPASEVGGPSFVKAVKGPCPWTNIMPTGGVDTSKENLQKWFDAGVTCVGMGSKLFPKDIIEKKDFNALTEKVKSLIHTIQEIKNKNS
ncbi:bifunctional 4-hydroxy-2-oxoglutarate aldolase/2-dehydro-3-deoxy-phosphogluconate aldolase [Thermophagus xiamenensis]|uniref:2-dehydro-3-deoxyphosphogluconate aldolase / (4S)-4-hydroxy-2-oxoglutarate aldolase n=1 Tax=Thermophagus xiamenensis TaxID=385682 RepID=A0A1I2BGM4_9BACT|nr:bifunctional 4-hydroxy-2-oxoglutarate aldolase/2-dehydro-3-deoxy-phosphogluconate aldolase [Thermophagus xiamenensis]SFE54433.1 2-dehydro-3-deoxyphosphogluconate aldolase / (4S)-4-hydroxy-2-oxoglutarate aldolase [Thermophagus xiamenensis]